MNYKLATNKFFCSALLGTIGSLAVFSPTVQRVEALTINRNFIDDGDPFPGLFVEDTDLMVRGISQPENAFGDGNLFDIFNAAANLWENIIRDPFELTLNFGWGETRSVGLSPTTLGVELGTELSLDGLERITESNILFFSGRGELFLDPTPNSIAGEYTDFSESTADLGGGDINVARFFSPIDGSPADNRFDVFTTALHEIGHALGLEGFFRPMISVGEEITIGEPLPNAGTQVTLPDGNHFPESGDLINALMSLLPFPDADVISGRTLPSVVDILAIAEVSDFTKVVLDPTEVIPDPEVVIDPEVVPETVPEPTTILSLLALGFLGAGSAVKKKILAFQKA